MKDAATDTSWKRRLAEVPSRADFCQGSMYETLRQTAQRYPDYTALTFQGRRTTFATVMRRIDTCARALTAIGIRAGDRVTLALPNCPQAVYAFYALNQPHRRGGEHGPPSLRTCGDRVLPQRVAQPARHNARPALQHV